MGTWPGDVAEPGELPRSLTVLPGPRTSPLVEAGVAAITVAVLSVLGAGVGLAWAGVSPHVVIRIAADGPRLQPQSGEEFFVAEGLFALIGLAVGLLTGVGLWYVLRRWRGPLLLAALIIGGLAGAAIAWQVGRHVGLAEYRELLRNPEVGSEFSRPVDVKSKGMLLIQPLAAAAAYVVLAFWTARPDLGSPRSG